MTQDHVTGVVPIDRETRSAVSSWAVDTLKDCDNVTSEIALAASYCIQYEAALRRAEKEIRRRAAGGAGDPVWPTE